MSQLEYAYDEFAEEVFGHPFGWERYILRSQYDHTRLERIVKKQVKRYLYDSQNEIGICQMCEVDGREATLKEMSISGAQCRV